MPVGITPTPQRGFNQYGFIGPENRGSPRWIRNHPQGAIAQGRIQPFQRAGPPVTGPPISPPGNPALGGYGQNFDMDYSGLPNSGDFLNGVGPAPGTELPPGQMKKQGGLADLFQGAMAPAFGGMSRRVLPSAGGMGRRTQAGTRRRYMRPTRGLFDLVGR